MKKELLLFRTMENRDILEVAFIEKDLFSMPWTEKSLLDALKSPIAYYFVVQYEEKIIGECGIWCCLDEGEITNIGIHKEYQNMGVGTMLLGYLLEQGKKIGITQFLLEVRESNKNAIKLYEKYNFKIEGMRKNFYEKPRENAIIMWKR